MNPTHTKLAVTLGLLLASIIVALIGLRGCQVDATSAQVPGPVPVVVNPSTPVVLPAPVQPIPPAQVSTPVVPPEPVPAPKVEPAAVPLPAPAEAPHGVVEPKSPPVVDVAREQQRAAIRSRLMKDGYRHGGKVPGPWPDDATLDAEVERQLARGVTR